MITHDLGVVAGMAEDITVMYSGKVVEEGRCRRNFYKPQHPYTSALLKAVPSMENGNKEELKAYFY